MNLLTPVLLFILVCVNNASSEDNSKSQYVNASSVLCETCISKCCNFGEYVKNKRCVSHDEDYNLPLHPVFTEDVINTGKVLKDYFRLDPGKFYNEEFKMNAINMYRSGFRHYLTKNRTIFLELPNAYQRWTKIHPSNYCIDYQLPNKYLKTAAVRVWVLLWNEDLPQPTYFITYGLIISCVFLAIVLFVYSVLPELRNLSGMILMAYVSSLLSSFIFLIAMQLLVSIDKFSCIGLTAPLYFSLMASFCWMSVMSCDVWWTFRGYAKARRIHRRGERFKFYMYSLYAWGVPLGMTIFLVVVNEINLTDYPAFITPMIPIKGCFLEDGQKLVYMYVPMLIISVMNWVFYLMTAFNIWRLNRGTAVLDSAAAGSPAAHRTQWHRFMVFLNLSVLMGVNWIFEAISSFKPNMIVWYITDTCNILIGVIIFFVFVFKWKIYKKLVKKGACIIARMKGQQRWSPYSKSRSSSTTESNISQDTPLQISVNPKGA